MYHLNGLKDRLCLAMEFWSVELTCTFRRGSFIDMESSSILAQDDNLPVPSITLLEYHCLGISLTFPVIHDLIMGKE